LAGKAKKEKHLGLYLHLPFCASRCAYCDFCSTAGRRDLIPRYQRALKKHLSEAAPGFEARSLDTVYFGGGTPSWYGAGNLCELMAEIRRHWHMAEDAEVTLEANPDSVTAPAALRLRRAGFNRISIGMQSANDAILEFIGRRHRYEDVLDAVEAARAAGFDNLSLDLIYGLPAQSREDWADTLTRAALMKPNHLSCYGLKLEEGTPLYRLRGSELLPDDDTQADMYLYTVDYLSSQGLPQYEISNFAQRGRESRHNLKYWLLEDYAGFGASAASCIGSSRFTFTRDVEGYVASVQDGSPLIEESEELSAHARASEYLMLGLRTVRGISEEDFDRWYRGGFRVLEPLLLTYQKYGYARRMGSRWCFTPKGFLVSNSLIAELLDTLAEKRSDLGAPWRQEDYYTSLF
jgi:oxygen-independent coproporphyrinogen-3 oxidase